MNIIIDPTEMQEKLYSLQDFHIILSLLYNACRGYSNMYGEENALTEAVCGSYRETVYNRYVLASKRVDSSSDQARNPDRSLLGHTGRNEAP